jgi:dihydrofolate synthase/folylpolyglutamate synthase
VIDFVEKLKPVIAEVQPSFFEITVAMAFNFFVEEKVDVAVIETGLGGRLDSTNIITPELSIITNISFDHMDLLGNTLPEIAAEKAGIIKHQVPVIIGEQQDETERVFFEHALRNETVLYYAATAWELVKVKQDTQYQYFKAIHVADASIADLKTDLLGSYQQHNIKTVLAAAELLDKQGKFSLPQEKTFAALSRVKQLTGLRGRWDWIQTNPLIIADVGHNPAGIKEVMQQWKDITARKKYILTGFVKDKDIDEALKMYPKDAVYYFCNAQIPRALPAADLAVKAHTAGLSGDHYPTIADGVKAALAQLQPDDALLITGSFFVVGEALEALGIN